MTYKDKTFCSGDGCKHFNECDRALTPEVLKGSQESGLPLSRFSYPTELDCYEGDEHWKIIHSARYILDGLQNEAGVRGLADLTGLPPEVVTNALRNILSDE